MSHCVPDWNENCGELDTGLPPTDLVLPVKGKWESLHNRSSHLSELRFVPVHVADDSTWGDDVSIVMDAPSNKVSKPQWQPVGYSSHWNSGQDIEEGGTPCKATSDTGKDGSLQSVINEPGVYSAVNANNIHDDEMVSWLQYPLDDSLERNYCSDFFGELPNSTQLLKDSFAVQGTGALGRAQRNPGPANLGNAPLNRAASADAAMALGAGRAAGLISLNGVEAFNKVRTTLQPFTGKCPPNFSPTNSKSLGALPTSSAAPARVSPQPLANASAPIPPPKSQIQNNFSFQAGRTGQMNFSHFSRPAMVVKANLHSLGMGGVGTGPNGRLKGQSGGTKTAGDMSTSSGSSIAESTISRRTEQDQRKESVQADCLGAQPSLGTGSSWPSMQNSLSSKDEGAQSGVESDSKALDQGNCLNSGATCSGVLSTGKNTARGTQVLEAPEPTITCSSGGSGNSADRCKEAASSGKRRTREGEESECQSEDGEYEGADVKKPQQRSSTTKRSRAAEVHNLSERRRRDRINEKMKALQELIPNSNKTDKASMLDEAIEYLKMLQLQLQMMSMRSGMSIPSMPVASGLSHLQMNQMATMPPMGMAIGMGMGPMGMGPMGMIDMGSGNSVRPMIPLPAHVGPSHGVTVTSSGPSMVDAHDLRMSGPAVMDSLNVYLSRHHHPQLQLPQPMNVDMYNAYLMHHHHNQQQHQLHHHLPSNMGSGAPQ